MSREILAFGVFGGLAIAQAVAMWLATDHAAWATTADVIGVLTCLAGLAAVGCSVMIYASTGRPLWRLHRTALRFALSCTVLGLPLALIVSLAAAGWNNNISSAGVMQQFGQNLCLWLILATSVKLVVESAIFIHLRGRQPTPLRRSAVLLADNLGTTTMLRYFFGLVGGLLLPAILMAQPASDAGAVGYQSLFLYAIATVMFTALLIAEMIERHLFFATSAAAKMPGARSA